MVETTKQIEYKILDDWGCQLRLSETSLGILNDVLAEDPKLCRDLWLGKLRRKGESQTFGEKSEMKYGHLDERWLELMQPHLTLGKKKY